MKLVHASCSELTRILLGIFLVSLRKVKHNEELEKQYKNGSGEILPVLNILCAFWRIESNIVFAIYSLTALLSFYISVQAVIAFHWPLRERCSGSFPYLRVMHIISVCLTPCLQLGFAHQQPIRDGSQISKYNILSQKGKPKPNIITVVYAITITALLKCGNSYIQGGALIVKPIILQ